MIRLSFCAAVSVGGLLKPIRWKGKRAPRSVWIMAFVSILSPAGVLGLLI